MIQTALYLAAVVYFAAQKCYCSVIAYFAETYRYFVTEWKSLQRALHPVTAEFLSSQKCFLRTDCCFVEAAK